MPRMNLDKTTVVRAAADLVNAEGWEALSLGKLADRLGIQTPSLYNHIDGLAGLRRELTLLSTRELGERIANAAIGQSGPEAVRKVAQSYREYVKQNTGLYMLGVRAAAKQNPPDPELQAAQERVVAVSLAVMAWFGLSEADALHAIRGLRSLIHGFATLEAAGGFGLPLDCDESFRRLVEMFIHDAQRRQSTS
jgi:AcrR family transcriptional regulator